MLCKNFFYKHHVAILSSFSSLDAFGSAHKDLLLWALSLRTFTQVNIQKHTANKSNNAFFLTWIIITRSFSYIHRSISFWSSQQTFSFELRWKLFSTSAKTTSLRAIRKEITKNIYIYKHKVIRLKKWMAPLINYARINNVTTFLNILSTKADLLLCSVSVCSNACTHSQHLHTVWQVTNE